ncbi:MAG: hypothetical protein BRC33_05740 [Cyanobacteria bacterium SW_9_44_58]|nr:MAG: hypothetical protein BRC33_05740 [Cyanobacteria bacterium SW_9_44_58]
MALFNFYKLQQFQLKRTAYHHCNGLWDGFAASNGDNYWDCSENVKINILADESPARESIETQLGGKIKFSKLTVSYRSYMN